MATKITVTELDRRLSDVLNRVAYQGESFVIERGGKQIAQIEPVGLRSATAREIAEKLGHLRIPEGFADDLEAVRASIPKLGAPAWLE